MAPQPVDSQVALITGANKGIGLEIARQLGRQRITVPVGARHTEWGKRLPRLYGSKASALILYNLTSLARTLLTRRRSEHTACYSVL